MIGTLLPEKTALTGLAQSMGDVLQAYFAEVNSRGGIYNRKIELRVMHGDSTSRLANMKHLIEDEQVFAIVSGVTAGAEEAWRRLVAKGKCRSSVLPRCIPQRGLPLNRYMFYLLPGLKEQARSPRQLCSEENVIRKKREWQSFLLIISSTEPSPRVWKSRQEALATVR